MAEEKTTGAKATPITKDHLLFGAVGLALGLLLGFTIAFQVIRPALPGSEGAPPRPPDEAGPGMGGGMAPGMGAGTASFVNPDGSFDMDKVPPAMKGQVEEAKGWVEEQNKLLEADPENADLLLSLGDFYLQFGTTDPAWPYFERAAKAAPDRPEVQEQFGDLAMRAGRYPEAIAAYEKALALLPDHAELLNDLATARLHTGDNEGALEALDRAIAKSPDHVRSHFNRAVVLLFGLKDADGAAAELDRAAALAPGDERIPELRRSVEEFRKTGTLPE